MESNIMSGGMRPNRNPDVLGLEMSLHHHIPPPQNPPLLPQQQQLPMMSYGHIEGDHHPQTQKSLKQGYTFSVKSKSQTLTLSDDDEPGLAAENSADDGKKKTSPWHRMKWTDDMVRLLIVVVFYIGDEVGSEGNDPANKKKSGVILQKKGKWKSVSRALMERGFYVSPQQCEDKFNDLNKRYKRVNEILGKGTACQVVENQSLLDTMDHLSSKMKDEVKKLLSSKHLFFREMCAYHNTCGHGGATATVEGVVQYSPLEVAAEPPQGLAQYQQQRCFHSPESIPVMPNINRGETIEGSKLVKGICVEDNYDDEDEEDEDDDESDDVIGGGSRCHDQAHDDDINEMDERSSRKRDREWACPSSPLIRQLEAELINILQDGMRSSFEKRQWLRTKLMQLDEQSVGIQYQSLALEKQRLKWLKFSTKKEREIEREKLLNERMKLENERMVLLIRQKEHDFLDHHRQIPQQASNKKNGDPSSVSR
ncbi:hypothetical protein F511_03257 [Dorcoceras hygrometricum]|uniref:Myb/SANT-like DNA-binding domain-containing protein n=1 Tax=Dorcoceras hygrometricum TaxID=472368 RepID=A0A2Z7B9K1_9LAMI|nr:hypothetical protein F511_03257 [Dorcoceras hygrometricum]